MTLLNFSHPLTEAQRQQLAALIGQPVEQVIEVKSHFDVMEPFGPQVVALVDGLGITPEQWQRDAWLVMLPSLNYAAGVVLAELHGRMGHFPAIVRLRSVPGLVLTEYEVAEIINLESVRQQARTKR
ncbi:CRISPR-associated protein Csx15 [Aggregatilineales bacterium SYSU G02658]